MKNTTRVGVILAISIAFFVTEISVGFYTKSLALIADAASLFHYLTDIVAYTITFVAAYLQENGHNVGSKNSAIRNTDHRNKTARFTYAFHRAELVGAFFNGVFLLALALSIFLQSIERFVNVEPVDSPILILIVGGVGLALNIASALVIHDHSGHGHGHGHSHGHSHGSSTKAVEPQVHTTEGVDTNNHSNASGYNLGLVAVLIHLLGDAVNNIGVMIAAVIMWKTASPSRFYADPAISMAISLMIFAAAIPTTIKTGQILLEASPLYLDLIKVKADLILIPGVLSVHDLHVWHLSQSVILASLHVCVPLETTLPQWAKTEQALQRCFAAYGVHHVTISPEMQKIGETSSILTEEHGGCKISSHDFGCSVTSLVRNRMKSCLEHQAGAEEIVIPYIA
ncbi:CDF zinc transporter [Amanita muscaria]